MASINDLKAFLQDLDLNDKVTAFATAGINSTDDLLKLDDLDHTLADLGCNNRTRKKIKNKLKETNEEKDQQATEMKEQEELDRKLKIKKDEEKKERIRKAKGPGKYSSDAADLNPGEEATGGDMFEDY